MSFFLLKAGVITANSLTCLPRKLIFLAAVSSLLNYAAYRLLANPLTLHSLSKASLRWETSVTDERQPANFVNTERKNNESELAIR